MSTRNTRRRFRMTIAALAASCAVAVAGCSGGASSGADGGKTELTFWHFYTDSRLDWLQGQVDSFEEAHPDVTIKLVAVPAANDQVQKLLASVGTHTTPDLFMSNPIVDFPTLVGGNVTADLTDYWNDFGDKDQFSSGAVWKSDDKVREVNTTTNLIGMYYNQDILDASGVDKVPTTIGELEDAMAKVKATGKYEALATSGSPDPQGAWGWAPLLLGDGINYCNLEGDKVVEMFDRIAQWRDAGYIPRGTASWDTNAAWQQFMSGDFAFAFNGNWFLQSAEESGFNYGTTQFPAPDGGVSKVYLGGEAYGIGESSEHKDLAWQFLSEAILSSDAQVNDFTLNGSIPTRTDAADAAGLKDDQYVAPFLAALQEPGVWPDNANTAKIQTTFGQMTSSVIAGQLSPEDGAQQAIDDIKAAIEDGGGHC